MRPLHFLALAIFATGCGSGNDALDFIDSYCNEVMSCCSQAMRPIDGSRCRKDMKLIAGIYTYDASATGACVAERFLSDHCSF